MSLCNFLYIFLNVNYIFIFITEYDIIFISCKKEGVSMENFKLVSPYKPTGDQPEAIDALVKGILK